MWISCKRSKFLKAPEVLKATDNRKLEHFDLKYGKKNDTRIGNLYKKKWFKEREVFDRKWY